MKKEITIGICFAVAGILCACFFGNEYFTTYGFLNEYHMRSFADSEMDTMSLLGNILWERKIICILMDLVLYSGTQSNSTYTKVWHLLYGRCVSGRMYA